MGYKLLGFFVWQALKLYMRQRARGVAGKAAIAGVVIGLIVGAGVVAQRQQSSR